MQHLFEELDYQSTDFGDISLRRRTEPRLDNQLIYEVKLGDEFLMSSLFVEAEEQLATLALTQLSRNGFSEKLDVVVGGLGLGYTALQALDDKRVDTLRTIDVMQPVIDWHRRGILPIGNVLAEDSRSSLIHADFFAVATDQGTKGFADDQPIHALLLDIDHSPKHWLNAANQAFYSKASLEIMASKIVHKGVFGLWSNELPDDQFITLLKGVFSATEAHVVQFANPYSGGDSTNTVYISTV